MFPVENSQDFRVMVTVSNIPRHKTGAMRLATASDRYPRSRMKEGRAEDSRKIVHRADAARSLR
jgi:hypothetical protein